MHAGFPLMALLPDCRPTTQNPVNERIDLFASRESNLPNRMTGASILKRRFTARLGNGYSATSAFPKKEGLPWQDASTSRF
jgi:hypothetical protein